jgi:hypothetical protein
MHGVTMKNLRRCVQVVLIPTYCILLSAALAAAIAGVVTLLWVRQAPSRSAQNAYAARRQDYASGNTPAINLRFARLALAFEPNRGQTDARVKFLARGYGYTLFLTNDEAVLSLRSSSHPSPASSSPSPVISRERRPPLERGAP